MVNLLKQHASAHGDKLRIVPVMRLKDLESGIGQFKNSEELNGFQKWIVSGMYKFEVPAVEFPIRSVIITAIPHPAYATAEFAWQGKSYMFMSMILSDFDNAEKYLGELIAAQGYHMKPAATLPLKRLAAQSGLAAYGRNNICYVEGMGSFFSFAAYYSDIPCDNDDWAEMRHAERCASCNICLNSCPTGAIRKDRFLIDNERCLSYFNEAGGEFPAWLPASAHHCLYDCMKCQLNCPMNKEFVSNVAGPVKFSEQETEMLLEGVPFDMFPGDLKQKAARLGLNKWPGAIPRNLKILMDIDGQIIDR